MNRRQSRSRRIGSKGEEEEGLGLVEVEVVEEEGFRLCTSFWIEASMSPSESERSGSAVYGMGMLYNVAPY